MGFYLGHRTTRDLDLFWTQRAELGELPARVIETLRHEGLEVTSVQTELSFHRLRVSDGNEVTLVDLVSDPMPGAHPAVSFPVGDVTVAVEPVHDILVSKLCALLGRAEVRDLIDVRALLAAGEDLRKAVADAPRAPRRSERGGRVAHRPDDGNGRGQCHIRLLHAGAHSLRVPRNDEVADLPFPLTSCLVPTAS